MNNKFQTAKFIVADWFSATLAWALFFIYRKLIIESQLFSKAIFLQDKKFFYGIFFIPIAYFLILTLKCV